MNRRSWFLRSFPPPAYLVQPAVGLDISDLSVKFAELIYRQGRLDLGRFADQAIPAGAIEGGIIKQPQPVIDSLAQLRANYDLKWILASLPEEQAYVVRLSLPEMSKRELRQSIELQLEEYVPLAGADMIFDYEIISNLPGRGLEVNVSVLPKAMVDSYLMVLTKAGFQPLAFEIEAQALARSLMPVDNSTTTLIVDIGKTRTSFAIVDDSSVSFTSTVDSIGGRFITKSIAKHLQISPAEAEKLKIAKGLLRSSKNQALFQALIPLISALRDEIVNILKYWRSHQPPGSEPVKAIILCGGQSTLPGLDDYLTANLSLPTTVGNPWRNILSLNEIIPDLDHHHALRYSTALGLALRQADHYD